MDLIKVRGKDIIITVNGMAIGCDETCDIEVSSSMITTTTKCSKDSNGNIWEEVVPNINSVKFTGNGIVPFSTSAGYDENSFQQLASAQFRQLKCYVTWGIAGTNLFYGMDGYLTTNKATGPYNDVSKYNYAIQGTGPITTAAIS